MTELNIVPNEPAPSYSIIAFKASELPETYKGFVYANWLKSNRSGNPLYNKVEPSKYYEAYHFLVQQLLSKPDSIVRIACLSDDQDVALGFSASREDVLDYIYVKKDYRNLGIATNLMPRGITTFSHSTIMGMTIWQKKDPTLKTYRFNPFA